MALSKQGKGLVGRNYKWWWWWCGGNFNSALLNENGAGTVESDLAVSQKLENYHHYDSAVQF